MTTDKSPATLKYTAAKDEPCAACSGIILKGQQCYEFGDWTGDEPHRWQHLWHLDHAAAPATPTPRSPSEAQPELMKRSTDSIVNLVTNPPTPAEFSVSTHVSWANARFGNRASCLVSTFRYGDAFTRPLQAWHDEVLFVTTDPTQPATVTRVCHHRSDCRHDLYPTTNIGFWYTPRANISPDGRWALFTSNWGKTLGSDPADAAEGCGFRQDVFLVELPNG